MVPLCCSTAMAKVFNYDGKYGYYDDRKNDEGKVSLYCRQVAEIVASHYKKCDPCDTAEDIVTGKTRVRHLPDPGYKGRKGSDDRDEPRYDYRFTSVLFIKFMGSIKIFLVKIPDIFLVKYFRTDKLSYRIVHSIAGDSCYGEKNQQPFDLEHTEGGKGAKSEQEGISRQKRSNDKAGFTKYYKKKNEICPAAKALNDRSKMPVKVNKEINEIEDQIHINF